MATLAIIATNNTERSSLQLCSALLYNPGLLTIKHFSVVRQPTDDKNDDCGCSDPSSGLQDPVIMPH